MVRAPAGIDRADPAARHCPRCRRDPLLIAVALLCAAILAILAKVTIWAPRAVAAPAGC